MEAFDDVDLFDQNVVSYLELLRMPYTGCNPRGLILSRDKSLSKKLMAYHRIPVPDFAVVPLGRKVELPKRLRLPADREVADLRIVDRHLAGIGGRRRRAAAQARRSSSTRRRYRTRSSSSYIDGRELYVGVMGNDRLQVFPVWEMSFSKMAETTTGDRHRAGEVERQVPEEARHRDNKAADLARAGGGASARWPSACIARSTSPATPASTCAWTTKARST